MPRKKKYGARSCATVPWTMGALGPLGSLGALAPRVEPNPPHAVHALLLALAPPGFSWVPLGPLGPPGSSWVLLGPPGSRMGRKPILMRCNEFEYLIVWYKVGVSLIRRSHSSLCYVGLRQSLYVIPCSL